MKNSNLVIGYLSKTHNVIFGDYNVLNENVVLSKCSIGDYCYIGDFTKISNTKIGKFCSIGSNVKIGLGIHPISYFTTCPAFYSVHKQCGITFVEKDLYKETGYNTIGNDVWVGDNVVILSNIIVGDGAVIGAGAVVTKNVEAYSIVGGVPAKHIKYRFSKERIKILMESHWWEKDVFWILKNMPEIIKK